jgi:hypothetical protein
MRFVRCIPDDIAKPQARDEGRSFVTRSFVTRLVLAFLTRLIHSGFPSESS